MSSGYLRHLINIFVVLGTGEQATKERAAKKDYGGGWESSALIGWHGNTDFFVLLRRERKQRILGIIGMMTGWRHTLTHTHTRNRCTTESY